MGNFPPIKRIIGTEKVKSIPCFFVQFEDENLRSMLLPIQLVPHHLVVDYYLQQVRNGSVLPASDNVANDSQVLYEICSAVPDPDLNALAQHFVTRKGLELPPLSRERLMKKLAKLEKFPGEDEVRELQKEILIERIRQKRQELQTKLRDMEFILNLKGDHTEALRVVNDVSCDPFPYNFTLVNSNLVPEGLEMKADGCQCTECCCCSENCSHNKKKQKLAYRIDKKIQKQTVNMKNEKLIIHECNKNCKCGPDCRNRVVQMGSDAKLELCYSINGCGWCVRAAAPIPKGTFVFRYVGEIIPGSEVPKRGSKYIFDIDVEKPEGQQLGDFAIDGDKFGNLARFLNHSCDPNIRIVAVHIDSSNFRLHEIAFFTRRHVETGEQLSIDYGQHYTYITDCRCGSVCCRKNLAVNGEIHQQDDDECRISDVSFNLPNISPNVTELDSQLFQLRVSY